MPESGSEPGPFRGGRKNVFNALLAASQPLTVRQLYTQLKATKRPIERSLKLLVEEGLVEGHGHRRARKGRPAASSVLYRPTVKGREVGSDYLPPHAGPGKLSGWGGFSVRRLAVVRVLLGADAAGLTTTGIGRLTNRDPERVREVLMFGLHRGLVRRAVISETPITYAYSLTGDGIEAGKAYVRAHSKTVVPQEFKVSVDPGTADLEAAFELLEQLKGMPGVTVS